MFSLTLHFEGGNYTNISETRALHKKPPRFGFSESARLRRKTPNLNEITCFPETAQVPTCTPIDILQTEKALCSDWLKNNKFGWGTCQLLQSMYSNISKNCVNMYKE